MIFGRNRRGMAIVEFALGSGVLLAAFSGTFEIGYSLIQYNKLETAVAQGARYASIVPYDSATATPSAAFSSAVKNMVLYGSPAMGSLPALSGLSAGNVNLTVTFANGVPSSIQVSISGYTIDALFRTYTLTGKPQVTYPYQGVWAPV
ncbi:MAG TPA: TadE/TadG family type IV pilus assembly protein [Bryobacteraceae bacterium]|nr:TadE/TadG family type IV pilus assembly protein [Bryobacteraceae bacterium]